MKALSKVRLILIFTIIFLIICSAKVLAASISVKPSKTSVSPGESFSATITASGATGKVNISVSNGSVSPNTLWLEPSGTVSVKAGASGNIKITVVAADMSDSSGNEVSPSGSATVTIANKGNSGGNTSGGTSGKPSSGGTSEKTSSGGSSNKTTTNPEEKEKSKDSTLSALTVKEGTITPEFNKDVKEYNLNVPYETTEINITATPTDSKAKVEVKGNKDLKEGENTVTITATAEDGSTSNYLIKVKRARVPLALKSLSVKYTNGNGELIEMPLNPTFAFDTLEYSLQDIEYWVEKISVEAEANIEGATIDIQGADNLQVGENTITITLKIIGETVEGQEPKEETINYTIKVNKLEEPTLVAKISNWFKGIFGGVTSWYNNNQKKVILGALGICIVALFGLSVYIVFDYKKYKTLVDKLKKVEELNRTEIVEENVAQNSVIDNFVENSKDVNSKKDDNEKGGKHF